MLLPWLYDDDVVDDALQIVITQNGSLQFPTWRIINAIPHSKLNAEKSKHAAASKRRLQLRQRGVCVFNTTKKSNMAKDTGKSVGIACHISPARTVSTRTNVQPARERERERESYRLLHLMAISVANDWESEKEVGYAFPLFRFSAFPLLR